MSAHFKMGRWYCGHCPITPEAEAFEHASACRDHLANVHEIPRAKTEPGWDLFEAWQAKKLYRHRQEQAEIEARAVARHLVLASPTYSVEDFLADAGDEPWAPLNGEGH